MDGGGNEIVSERIHLHDRGQTRLITIIIRVESFGQRRAGCRFNADDLDLGMLPDELVTSKGKRDSRKIGSATNTTYNNIGI